MHYLGKFDGKTVMAAENYFSVEREVKPAESSETSETDQSPGKHRKLQPGLTAHNTFVKTLKQRISWITWEHFGIKWSWSLFPLLGVLLFSDKLVPWMFLNWLTQGVNLISLDKCYLWYLTESLTEEQAKELVDWISIILGKQKVSAVKVWGNSKLSIAWNPTAQ